MADLKASLYVMDLAVVMETLSLYVTKSARRAPLPCLTGLTLYLCTRQSPHPPGLQQTRGKCTPGGRELDTQGNVIIWGLWEIQTDTIIEVRFGDSDADTYNN